MTYDSHADSNAAPGADPGAHLDAYLEAHLDADLDAVRATLSARTAGSEQALGRVWSEFAARQAATAATPPPERGRRSVRWLVPAGAAATVAAVAVSTVVTLGGQGDGGGDPYAAGQGPSVAEVLDELAEAAERTAPLTVADGQVLYQRTDGWGATFGRGGDPYRGTVEPFLDEVWFDPTDPVPMQLSLRERDGETIEEDHTDEEWYEEVYGYRRGERSEPGIFHPSEQWLAELPTDPERMLVTLRAEAHPAGSPSADHKLWEAMQVLYRGLGGPLSPGPQRAAMLRSLAGLDGLSTDEITVDGRVLVAVRHTLEHEDSDQVTAQELLFDPDTGRAVGHRTLFLEDGVTLEVPDGAPELAAGVVSQSVWEWAVVDEVGERG